MIYRTLWDDMWLNQATSYLRADFVVYNSNIQLFCQISFVRDPSALLPLHLQPKQWGDLRTI